MRYIINCTQCEEKLAFNCEATEGFVNCPKCGCRNHVRITNGKAYTMSQSVPKKSSMSKKAKKAVIVAVAIIALVAAGIFIYSKATAPNVIETTSAFADKESLWNDFRAANPYNVQMVGLKSYDDGSYTIIISEPDENVSINDLEKLFKKYNASISTFQYTLGYDGWLKDAVVCFNDINEKGFVRLQSRLFELLYGTDYKSFFYDFNDKMPHHVEYAWEPLNYQISDEELKEWVVDSDEHFFDSDNTYNNTFTHLMSAEGPNDGIFYSTTPGLVAWMITNNEIDVNTFKTNARKFSLDSDLIIGAFKKAHKIAIIGKERTAPLNELPPMRLSTIMMLASTIEKELSQSYERNNFFAGKLPGGKDYAPILLSDELWHTEYGSMLNITDQMLKSWSQNADIHYEAFNYPEPIDWAFEVGAYQDLDASELTYNWNTAGAGYVVEASEDCPYEIFAINRTGSLPVSYIPGESDEIDEHDKTYEAEERAYDLFSNLSNPELVKVNQYASLYQVFSNFGISVPWKVTNHPVTTNRLDSIMGNILQNLKVFGNSKAMQDSVRLFITEKQPEELRRMAQSPYVDEEQKLYLTLALLFSDEEKEADETIESLKRIGDKIDSFRFKSSYAENKYERVGHYFVNPREIDYDEIGWLIYYWDDLDQLRRDNNIPITPMGIDEDVYRIMHPNSNYVSDATLRDEMVMQSSEEELFMFNAFQLLQHIDMIRTFNNALSFCSLTESKDIYLAENANSCNQWIKCPTIVQSWSVMDSVTRTGGHNLNSRVTPIKIDPKLQKGVYRIEEVNGKKIMVISPSDRGVSPNVLRLAERTNKAGEFKYTKAQSLRARPRTAVFGSAEKRSARGFNVADHVKITGEEIGFKIDDKQVNTMDELFAELHSRLQEDPLGREKALTFENVNERTVRLVSDEFAGPVYLDKGKTTKAKRGSFEMGKVVIDESRSEEGIAIVKVPIRTDNPNIRSRTHIFEVPKQYLKQFLSKLKEFLTEINKEWNFMEFKRTLDGSGIDVETIKETDQYMIVQLMIHQNKYYHVLSIEEEIA